MPGDDLHEVVLVFCLLCRPAGHDACNRPEIQGELGRRRIDKRLFQWVRSRPRDTTRENLRGRSQMRPRATRLRWAPRAGTGRLDIAHAIDEAFAHSRIGEIVGEQGNELSEIAGLSRRLFHHDPCHRADQLRQLALNGAQHRIIPRRRLGRLHLDRSKIEDGRRNRFHPDQP